MATKDQKNDNSIYKYLVTLIGLVTISISPWWNIDSMIIPKNFVVVIGTSILIIYLVSQIRKIEKNRDFKIILSLSVLFFAQLILSFITSEAPFAQQLYGREGRGLGLLLLVSCLIIFLVSIISIKQVESSEYLIKVLVFVGLISSTYSLLQKFGFDLFKWNTATNGIIGTLGNPNFQGSLAAVALVPTLVYFYFWKNKVGKIFFIVFLFLISYFLILANATQGYISAIASVLVYLLVTLWQIRKKFMFFAVSLFSLISILLIAPGTLGHGIFSKYLYKISVQSRGDFWRSAKAMAINNPVTGVGVDSFGDNFLIYRDEIAANHTFAEFADNAHNYYLELAATGGLLLGLLFLVLNLYVIFAFFKTLKYLKELNPIYVSLFSAWIALQLQSIVSPGNIAFYCWHFLISGSIIGIYLKYKYSEFVTQTKLFNRNSMPFQAIAIIVAILIMFPYFRVDYLNKQSLETGDGTLALKVAKMYPQSTIRMSSIGRQFLNSNFPDQSLEIGREAIQFNPKAVSAWALIVVNDKATREERLKAKNMILKLDPLNKIVKDLVIN